MAAEQGSSDPNVVVENYLGEEEARKRRRESMREEPRADPRRWHIASAFVDPQNEGVTDRRLSVVDPEKPDLRVFAVVSFEPGPAVVHHIVAAAVVFDLVFC